MSAPITVEMLQIPMLRAVGVEMLSRLVPVSEMRRYSDGERVYSHGEPAHNFYICYSGEVLSEQPLSPDITATVSIITPGTCFGWPVLLPNGTYRSDTVSQGNSECIRIDGAALRQLIDSDHEIGYHLLRGMCESLVDHLFTRTDQLIQLLSLHPDLRTAITRTE